MGGAECSGKTDDKEFIVGISAAEDHTCAAWSDGTAWCWGRNGSGQLGYAEGGSIAQLTPVPVGNLSCVEEVAVGAYHGCARTRGGAVYCWGDNLFGSLGNEAAGGPTPAEVTGLGATAEISTLGFTVGARLQDGSVAAWGSWADNGELAASPQLVAIPPVTALGVGNLHACAVVGSGVWCWGQNWYGGLGDGTTVDRYAPQPIAGIDDSVSVVTGYGFSCSLSADGHVKCWGANEYGQLGNGTREDSALPVDVVGVSEAVQLAAGHQSACARLASGQIACWGKASFEIGDNLVPTTVAGVTDVTDVTVGDLITCVVQQQATMLCWGTNTFGQLGDGTVVSRPDPQPVQWPWLQ